MSKFRKDWGGIWGFTFLGIIIAISFVFPLVAKDLNANRPSDYHTVIIGGGLAGMTALLRLEGEGIDADPAVQHQRHRHHLPGAAGRL